jgi:hypothetical protein
MNYSTTIAIPLTQYYAFVSDVGEIAPLNEVPTSEILAKALVHLAEAHPSAYRDLSLAEKRQIKSAPRDCATLEVGMDCIDQITNLANVSPKKASLVARALISDYLMLEKNRRIALLETKERV